MKHRNILTLLIRTKTDGITVETTTHIRVANRFQLGLVVDLIREGSLGGASRSGYLLSAAHDRQTNPRMWELFEKDDRGIWLLNPVVEALLASNE